LKIPESYLRCAKLTRARARCCPLVSCLSNQILLVAIPSELLE
jgi:hypothetical protein